MTTTGATTTCPYCGMGAHIGKCPCVKAFEFYEDGTIKRVEFYDPQPINSQGLFFTGPGQTGREG